MYIEYIEYNTEYQHHDDVGPSRIRCFSDSFNARFEEDEVGVSQTQRLWAQPWTVAWRMAILGGW